MKRKSLYIVLASLSFSLLLFAAQASIPISGSGILKWVSPTQDVNNAPEILASAEVALTATDVLDLNVAGTPLRTIRGVDPDGTKGWPITTLVTGMPSADYKIWVRVLDLAGNASVWSLEPATIALDVTPPKPPTGVSCSS